MGNTLKFKKKEEMYSSDSDRLRNQFNSNWRTQKTELVDRIVHLYQNEELTDVLFVFNRNDSITVFTLFLNFYYILWLIRCFHKLLFVQIVNIIRQQFNVALSRRNIC